MAAGSAERTQTPEMIVREMSEHLEELAAAGEWQDVERLMGQLHSVLLSVPEYERRPLVVVVQRSVEAVAENVRAARDDVAGRISTLRRGQRAAKAYKMR
ncbi:MAG: hypothetical protein QNI99_18390 [Woeseiaceae bacterium]|nr:hypothetical protein [Woeseiaceae bacterium]